MNSDFKRLRIGEDLHLKEGITNKNLWFLGVEMANGQFVNHEFRNTDGGLTELESFITSINDGKIKATVFAIWPGQWRTDAFLIEPRKLIPILKEAMKK